jgi:hypothetical protein
MKSPGITPGDFNTSTTRRSSKATSRGRSDVNCRRVIAAFLFALIPSAAIAVEGSITDALEGVSAGRYTLSAAYERSSGKYGERDRTDIETLQGALRYRTDDYSLKLTVPWLQITGPGNVIAGFGPAGGPQFATSSSAGLGDIVVAGSRVVFESTWLPSIDLSGKVKFGTADTSRGLGTGKNDYTIQAEFYRPFGRFTALASLGYKWYGDPPGSNFNNVTLGSLGGAYKLNDRSTLGIIVDSRQKVTRHGAPMLESTSYLTYRLNRTWRFQVYVVNGFADGSADLAVGGVLFYDM